MTEKENADQRELIGVSEGQQAQTVLPGEGIMATSVQEVNGMPEQYQEIGRQAIERFRRLIAKTLKRLGHEADSPRYVEAFLRQAPSINHPTHMLSANEATMLRDVADAIQALDENYRPRLYEEWCEILKIPGHAYVDIYVEFGMLDKIEIRAIPQQVTV